MLITHWTKLLVISKLHLLIATNLVVAASAAVAKASAATVATAGVATPALVAAKTWLTLCIHAQAQAAASVAINTAGLSSALATVSARTAMKAKVVSLGVGARSTGIAKEVIARALERGFMYGPV